MKKTVLCFGDSNTYGSAPAGERYGIDIRWPRRMATLLGDDYDIIESALGGRTCLQDDPVEGGYKSGAAYLPPCLLSHNPLDLVIIMLGVNDTKERYALNAFTIAQGAGELIKLVKQYGVDEHGNTPKILLVSPILVGENLMQIDRMNAIFGEAAIGKAKGFAVEFKRIADEFGVEFIDAAKYAEPSPRDAIHMEPEGQLALAEAFAAKVREIL